MAFRRVNDGGRPQTRKFRSNGLADNVISSIYSRSRSCPLSQHYQKRRPQRSRVATGKGSRRTTLQRASRSYTIGQAGVRMSSLSQTPTPLIPDNGAVQCLPKIQPHIGELAHLPTRAEAQALLTLADAYVLELPVKNANDILLAVDQVAEKDKSISLSHLRRFAKSANLPRYVQDRLRIVRAQRGATLETTLKVLDINKIDDASGEGHIVTSSSDGESIFLLVGLTRLVQLEVLRAVLERHGVEMEVFRTRVPISPPMNPTLAREWSDLYWPTQYRKSTPLGPHPTVIRQGTETVMQYSGYWMAQVTKIAQRGLEKGIGPAIGALIVDSKGLEAPAPVAIAADARYGLDGKNSITTRNVMNHAVMRAIGLVGRKRMSLATPPRDSPQTGVVLDYPLLDTEQSVFNGEILPPGGYLCTGLDIYLTHEPCIMCAQAILHSRFDKVIFRRRMSKTGAATPERPGSDNAGLGYGLFWRPELNWRLLVWEWRETADNGIGGQSNGQDDGVLSSTHA